jgi:hypothetical protein
MKKIIIVLAAFIVFACKKEKAEPQQPQPNPIVQTDSMKFDVVIGLVPTDSTMVGSSNSINRSNKSGFTADEDKFYFVSTGDTLVVATDHPDNIIKITMTYQKGGTQNGLSKAQRVFKDGKTTIIMIPIL